MLCLCPTPADAGHFYNEKYERWTNVISDALYSSMLGREVKYSIYLPSSYFREPDRSYPVLYYLHGFDVKGVAYQDWLNWHLDETLDKLIESNQVQEMIVVMPECFSSGFLINWGYARRPKLPPPATFPFRLLRGAIRSAADPTYFGSYLFLRRRELGPANYADFLTDEFIPYIESNYRAKTGRDARAITGFSSGGYSALSIAFKNTDLFGSVSAHSPTLVSAPLFSSEAAKAFVEFDPEAGGYVTQRFSINLLRRMFRNEETWQANNPIVLARNRTPHGLDIYIDVAAGDKRKYDVGACELVRQLRECGVPVRFELVEGLPPTSSHTYPGFINGKVFAKYALGKSDEELYEEYGWDNLSSLINPNVQRIECSLTFHSQEFSKKCD